MVRFAIVGAGGHGRVIADIILACGGEIAFVVDDSPQGKILANKNAISPKEFLMLGLHYPEYFFTNPPSSKKSLF